MDISMILAAASFVGVLAVVFLVMSLAGRSGAEARRRLSEHEVPIAAGEAKRLERHDILKDQNYSSFRVVNALLRRFRPAGTAAKELRRANSKLTVPQYLCARLIVAAILAFVVVRLTGVALFAVPAGLVGLMLPRFGLRLQARRRRAALEAQLAEAIDLLVGALRAGYGFLQAVESVSKEIGSPMNEELARVMEQVNAGTTPVDALQVMSQRVDSYDLAMFVTAVTVQRSAGGNLAEVLENIAETVRERRRIRAEVRAITTSARASSYVLGLFPLALMLFFSATDDSYRQVMLEQTMGKYIIAFAGVMSLVGFLGSNAIAKVEY